MSLTGRLLPIVLVILLVAALVATLLLWGRIRGPEWGRRGQRLGLLLANQIVAVALVGVLINDAGDFFSSWSDLFGQGRHSSSEYAVGDSHPLVTPPLTDITNTTFSKPDQWAARGDLAAATVTGDTSGLSARIEVYRPPQYFQAAYAHDTFPVIEVVDSGQGASVGSDSATIASTFLRAVQTDRARPAVLVVVDATGRNWDAACVSSASGPQTPAFLDADVPMALVRAYRVQPLGWGITGVDAGGYCAAKMALTEPNVFWASAPADAYFVPSGRLTLTSQNDLLLRLRSLPVPPAHLLLLETPDIGRTAAAQATTVRSLTHQPMQVSVPATHPIDDAAATEQGLEWLTQHIPAVRAQWQ